MHICVCHCKVKAYYFLWKYLNHSIVIKMQHNIEGFFLCRYRSYLQVPCSSQNRFDSPHAVIIVVLRWELLRAQSIRSYNLHWERSCSDKSTGIQHNLSYQSIVWHHHSYSPEESLQQTITQHSQTEQALYAPIKQDRNTVNSNSKK